MRARARLPLPACQRALAVVWYALGLLPFLILIVQTLRDVYQDKTQDVWGLFLPSLLPTMTLVTSVLAVDALSAQRTRTQTVDRFFFRLTLGLSIVYLLLLSGVLLYRPLSELSPLAFFQRANLFLGPFQGLVSAALGVLFVSRRGADAG